MTDPVCWVLTEGHIGMENQALGVAEAMGLTPVVKQLHPRWPWSWLPPGLWPTPLRAPGAKGDPLAPPWPDLLITCGKRATAPAIKIRQISGGRTYTVHIQKPPMDARHFDLLLVPAHDGVTGENIFVTSAAVHRVTPEKLAAAADVFGPAYAHLPRPWIAVLIGGANNRYKLTPTLTTKLAEDLKVLATRTGGSLLVTPSRRTGAENEAILRETLADVSGEIWDGQGENPYFGFLGLADTLLVTCDSVSMTSEACSTGKPVYVIDLEGTSTRIEAFQARLRDDGIARRFTGEIGDYSYTPPDDTQRAAALIREKMAQNG
jgi:mitochondrial fission protein ELM1